MRLWVIVIANLSDSCLVQDYHDSYTRMFVVKNKFIFLSVSALLVLVSAVSIAVKGFNIGIEFTGGSMIEVAYDNRPDITLIQENLVQNGFDAQVQNFGDNGVIVRTRNLSESEHQAILGALSVENQSPQEKRFNAIGPSIGRELRSKAFVAIGLVLLLTICFITYAFRKVSKPVASWKYGVVAIITLFHDVVIPAGVFALLGYEVNSLFIVGILSILGLSINDTIVVFDRVRENLKINEEERRAEPFAQVVGRSLRQTIVRSMNTSLALILVLTVLYFLGPVSTHHLALVLGIGMLVGTYSSICVASPLLVVLAGKKAHE